MTNAGKSAVQTVLFTAARVGVYAANRMPNSVTAALPSAGRLVRVGKHGIAVLLVLTAPYPALTRTVMVMEAVAVRAVTATITMQILIQENQRPATALMTIATAPLTKA